MSKFKYQERSSETVAARAKQSGGSYDSYLSSTYSFVKVKEGQNEFRILPPTWDVEGPFGDNWGIEVYVHREIGPDKGTYLCLDKMREKYGVKTVPSKLGACPLCAARHEVDEADDEALKALKPGKQILALIVDRNAEKDGPQVWRLGWQLERDIQIRSQDKKTGAVIALDHPDRGYDISFTREGAGLKTKYVGVDIAREDSPLAEKQVRQDKWLDLIAENPLSEQLVFFDADYLEQVYMGKGKKGGSAEDEEEDDRPKRTTRARGRDADEEEETPRRRRPAAADEDEEDDTKGRPRAGKPTSDGQDDDDEPAPRRRRAAAEEDDEPAPTRRKPADEEEEDEPAPRRRRAAAEADEEEDRPRRRKPADDDNDDRLPTDEEMARNSPQLKKRRPAEDDDDEPAPRRRRAAAEEDEEEETPRRRRPAAADEDEEEPQPRRTSSRKPAADEDEDDEPAPKGKASDRAKQSLARLGKK